MRDLAQRPGALLRSPTITRWNYYLPLDVLCKTDYRYFLNNQDFANRWLAKRQAFIQAAQTLGNKRTIEEIRGFHGISSARPERLGSDRMRQRSSRCPRATEL